MKCGVPLRIAKIVNNTGQNVYFSFQISESIIEHFMARVMTNYGKRGIDHLPLIMAPKSREICIISVTEGVSERVSELVSEERRGPSYREAFVLF